MSVPAEVLNGVSRHRRGLEIGALVTCILMVLLSATVIIAAQGRSQRSEVNKRMASTSALAAAYVDEQTTSLGALVAAYADRPTLRDALQARPGDRAAAATFQALQGGLMSARPGVTVTFLTDTRGVALAVRPATPAAIGKNFAFRDWYGGALRTRGPYISEAYQSAAVGRPFVVAASTTVRSKATAAGPGRVLGILAATYSLSSFQKFADDYAARTGIELLILDQRGVLIADGGHPPKPGAGLQERRAAGRRAMLGQGVVSAKTTDPGTGWTVVSQVPVEAVLGPATSFRGVVLLAAALMVVLLVGGAGVGIRIRRNRRIAEAAARESEERAQLARQRAREDVDRFFSLSLDLLCIASTDGYFKQINPAWKDALGYETEELLGQPFASFIHPDDLDSTSAEVVKLMGGASSTSFENRYRCKDGSYRWLLWKVSPLPDQGLMYAVARDNTERRRVEQAAARLAAIVDSSVDAIVGADLDGVVTSWNRGAEQIFGYRPDEIVGLSMDVLAPPGDDLQDDFQDDLLTRAARGEVIAAYEASKGRRDGQLIEVSLTTSPVRDPDGAVIGISMIARDISESRRTAEALQAIIATASDGFISMDAGGLITEWNHRAEELFGWLRDEAIGRDLATLIIPESAREAHRAGLDRVLRGAGDGSKVLDQLIEVWGVHRDGRQIPVELAVWRVQAGPVEQFSAFVRDISARQQIAKDAATARDEALEASRLKSAFLATMSHEIRTPMNGVIGLTGLLLRGDLEATQRRYAEGIDVAGNALLAVINDVLDFSKIEAGALILDDTAVNLGALLENVVELASQSARSKGLELLGYCDPRLPMQLRGDPGRIRQILLNLATNAVKFTEQGEVYIHILPGIPAVQVVDPPADPEQIAVRFEVTDTGLGIEDGDLARLFDVFAQADTSTTRKSGGTGLGLAICRELAEAMGGQVGVQSQPGHGSTFWCQIPLLNDPTGQLVPARLDANMQGRRVLVVVENDTNKLILAQQLSSWAMLPKVASGQEALDHLRDASVRGEFYDVAILDKDLSGIDGLDLAAQIQAFTGLPPIPIILITSGEPVETGRAHQAGVVACLTKPVQQSVLYDCLVSVAAANIENQARRASAPVAAATPVAATHGHLLLVEDNEINQMVASGILTELGYTVDVANDGLEALELVGRSAYRAVLMDCQMPNMDGYQATSELRRRESAAPELDDHLDNPDSTLPRRVPIIAMTAAALKEDRDRCLAAGMDDYLTKPIQPDDLAAAITRWTNAATTPAPEATTTVATTTEAASTEQAITNRLQVLRNIIPEPAVQRLVTSFLKRAPAYLADLTNALDRRDADALANTAHSLNGVASNLGAGAVSTLCDELETVGRNGGLQLAPDLLNRLRTEYEAARRTFQAAAHDQ